MQKKTIELIDVISNKGGVGKSTFSHNLMVGLTLLKKRVLGIDADGGAPCGHKYLGLNMNTVPPMKTLFDFFTDQAELKQIFQKTDYPNLAYVPGISLEQWQDMKTRFLPQDIEKLRSIFSMALPIFDYVVMDTPPGSDMRLIQRAQKIFVIVNGALGADDNNIALLKRLYLDKAYSENPKAIVTIINNVEETKGIDLGEDIKNKIRVATDVKMHYRVLPRDPFIEENPIFVTQPSRSTEIMMKIIEDTILRIPLPNRLANWVYNFSNKGEQP
jgi:MinD-like ATPase involved in chromosome partitioning or flagellar assembly